MKSYHINNDRKILVKADVYAREIASGIFYLHKSRHGKQGFIISSEDMINVFNTDESKVAIENMKCIIHTNFEVILPPIAERPLREV